MVKVNQTLGLFGKGCLKGGVCFETIKISVNCDL